MPTPKLGENQKRFCEEYIIDLNGTRAAIAAGYSKKTAEVQASRLLRNAKVKEFVDELIKKRSERTEITADMVIQELAKVGFSNIQNFVSADNEIKDVSEIDIDMAAAIASVKKTKTRFGEDGLKEVVEIKTWDKVAALEKLGRHLGVFEKDNAQSKPDTNITVTRTVITKKV